MCKNAHRLFDNGPWTLSDDPKAVVAEGRFAGAGPDQHLARHHGRPIHRPGDAALWPNPVHMAWPRRKRFKGA